MQGKAEKATRVWGVFQRVALALPASGSGLTLCRPLEAATEGGYTPPRNPAAQESGQLGGYAAECDRLCENWLRGSGPLGLG